MNSLRGNPPPKSGPPASGTRPLFDPQQPERELVDELAEQQANKLTGINSNQLRRFFGDVKSLYRQLQTLSASQTSAGERQTLYAEQIEARFKMIRSKVAYARRKQNQAQVPEDFAGFLDHGIKSCNNAQDFEKFVLHFEAVVGFLYGKDKVKK